MKTNMPWIIFSIAHQRYALNVKNITSIFQMENNVTPVAEYPKHFRGIMILRGDVVPMLEMRMCLSKETMGAEYNNFVQMIDRRKQDHINWVTRLKDCLTNDLPFDLATDPHLCAFGKWYDSYDSDIESVIHHLAKIDQPHQALHNTALQAFACRVDDTECRTNAIADAGIYMNTLLGLLDETKEILRAGYKEMCIVLGSGQNALGLIVDEVTSVETLTPVKADGLGTLVHSPLVAGIAHAEHAQGEILMLDEQKLFAMLA